MQENVCYLNLSEKSKSSPLLHLHSHTYFFLHLFYNKIYHLHGHHICMFFSTCVIANHIILPYDNDEQYNYKQNNIVIPKKLNYILTILFNYHWKETWLYLLCRSTLETRHLHTRIITYAIQYFQVTSRQVNRRRSNLWK